MRGFRRRPGLEDAAVSRGRGKRKWILAGALALLCLLLAVPAGHVLFAVRVGLSLRKLAAGTEEPGLSVREAKVRLPDGARSLEALTYRPARAPADSAVVIVAGLSELGCYHPRLVALSRILADNGLFVVTPDIREFRTFEITAEPIRQIGFWFGKVPGLQGGEKVRKSGLAGISFSATLAMMAAARPEIRDRVGFIVGIGPYSDLDRCARGWFAADPRAVPKNCYPTRFYAKWIIMRAALDRLPSASDRAFLRNVLDALLLQKDVPPAGPGLTPEGARWYALAVMPEDRTDAALGEEIRRHLTAGLYPQLDPSGAVRRLKCPVFLVHGLYDDLIPPEESVELHARIPRSYLLLSPFLTHTHPTDKTLSFGQKIRAVRDTVVFCYHLSRGIR